MTHDPSRTADQSRLRRSCPPELPSTRAGWQCALTSSAGIQTIPVESPLRRSFPGSALTLPGPPGPGSMGRSMRTALEPSSPLGWVEIRHPFHPLRGQRFEVLKKRRVAGVDTLILRELERGSFSVAREWTDWADPTLSDSLGLSPQRLDARSLVELVTLLEVLTKSKQIG